MSSTKFLNGWQRLFVLVCIVIAVLVLFAAKVPKLEPNIELALVQVSPKYAKSIKEGKKEYTIEELITAIDNFSKEFKMPDGIVIRQNPDIVTQSEVEEAYKLAKARASDDYWSRQLSSYVEAFGYYFTYMVGLYVFGWLMAWVIRGYRK